MADLLDQLKYIQQTHVFFMQVLQRNLQHLSSTEYDALEKYFKDVCQMAEQIAHSDQRILSIEQIAAVKARK